MAGLISYTLGIPAANNNPSQDQPNMQTNNDHVKDIIAVDHVTFNQNYSGQHLQVTFNSNNVPSTSPAFPTLFTNAAGGANQLFFYTQDPLHGSSQYVNASSGSTLLMGGIILKWGTITVATVSSTAYNFVSPFINNCWSVVLSSNITAPFATFRAWNVSAVTTSNFTASFNFTGNYYYIAIGN